MPPFTRNLTFVANNLGRESTLLLVFDNTGMSGQYRDVFPVAWRVSPFGATGTYISKFTYNSEFGFARAQINSEDIVEASAFTHINPGEKTTLEAQDGGFQFTTPRPIQPPSPNMVVINATVKRQNIGFGVFDRPARPPQTVLLFDHVNAGSSVQMGQFRPIISAYINAEYKEGQILRAQPRVPVILKESLADLDEDTTWQLKYNQGTGQYRLEREL